MTTLSQVALAVAILILAILAKGLVIAKFNTH